MNPLFLRHRDNKSMKRGSTKSCVIIYLGKSGSGFDISHSISSEMRIKYDTDFVSLIDQERPYEEIITARSALRALVKLSRIAISILRPKKETIIVFPMHNLASLMLQKLVSKVQGCTVITMLHDINPKKGEKIKQKAIRLDEQVQGSSMILALSKTVLQKLKKLYPGKDIKAVNHPPYLLARSYCSSKSSQKYDDKGIKKKITFIGRLCPYKGIETFLQIADQLDSQILKEIGPNKEGLTFEFNIIGRPSPDLDSRIIKQIQLTQNISSKMKYVSKSSLYEYIHDSHFIILPYIDASQSGIIPLCYDLATYIIASPIQEFMEASKIYSNVIVVDTNEVSDYCRAIVNVLKLGRSPDCGAMIESGICEIMELSLEHQQPSLAEQ